MKSTYKVTIALFAGAAIGGLAIHGLHAQATPPVYVVAEIEVTNLDAYVSGAMAWPLATRAQQQAKLPTE